MQVIDADSSEDDAEISQVNAAELNINSSDSEHLPRQKIWQVTRKVWFSHPLAYLDPHFILKKQQHDAMHKTRSDGNKELVSGLPNTPVPRKRHHEVLLNPTLSFPKAGLIRQPLNLSDSNYQGTSHSSSGDSTGTQIPTFKISHG